MSERLRQWWSCFTGRHDEQEQRPLFGYFYPIRCRHCNALCGIIEPGTNLRYANINQFMAERSYDE